MRIYIVFDGNTPYRQNKEPYRFFMNPKKAENYRKNAVRSVGRKIYDGNTEWYELKEEEKKKYFDKANKMLRIIELGV
ncbi:MAG: hypothetical protein E7K00_14910 [Clostridium perfringens]|nr:hypothetical protein [Clostridium perfringens]